MNTTDKKIKQMLDKGKTYKDIKKIANEIFYDPIIIVVEGWGKETEYVTKYDVRNINGYIFVDVWLSEVI